jgi:hypothetical protein
MLFLYADFINCMAIVAKGHGLVRWWPLCRGGVVFSVAMQKDARMPWLLGGYLASLISQAKTWRAARDGQCRDTVTKLVKLLWLRPLLNTPMFSTFLHLATHDSRNFPKRK